MKQILTKMARHELFIPFLAGIALRLALMPFFIWPHDIVAHYYSVLCVLNGYDPYSLLSSMYPPLIYIVFCPLLWLACHLGMELKFSVFPETFEAAATTGLITSIYGSPAFFMLWKTPLLIFDSLSGILIYQFVKKLASNPSKAKMTFILWFFNPYSLITSYIHGAFDVIVAFFILLGIRFLVSENYLLSGISLGLGGLTKLSPFMIAIPISGIIFLKKCAGSSLRESILTIIKFLAGCAIPLVICLPWCINYYNLLNTATLNEISINGGVNQWFFVANQDLRRIVNSNVSILLKIFYLYPLISLIPILFHHKTLKRADFSLIALLFSILSLEILYFVLPLTAQPQYLMWITPILLVVYAKRKPFLYPFIIFSFAASAFFFSIQSPFAFMYPLALFTPLYTIEQINDAIIGYASKTGTFCLYLREDLCAVFGAIAFLGHLLALYLTIRELSIIGRSK